MMFDNTGIIDIIVKRIKRSIKTDYDMIKSCASVSEDKELFVCEGTSVSENINCARDPNFQAICKHECKHECKSNPLSNYSTDELDKIFRIAFSIMKKYKFVNTIKFKSKLKNKDITDFMDVAIDVLIRENVLNYNDEETIRYIINRKIVGGKFEFECMIHNEIKKHYKFIPHINKFSGAYE